MNSQPLSSDSADNPKFSDPTALEWPAPAPFSYADPPPAALAACTVELLDESRLEGLLVDLDQSLHIVSVWPNDGSAPQPIPLPQIRMIRLHPPMELAAPGTTPQAHRRAFTVTFNAGPPLRGITVGIVKAPAGAFLYLAEGDSVKIVNCFIPSCSIADLRIDSPAIERAGVESTPSPSDLAAVTQGDTKQRQEKIGRYLSQRAINSPEELLAALEQQGKRPAARLGDILIESGAITAAQLTQALALQAKKRGRRIGDILIDMGAVSVRLIQVALSDKLGIPYVNARTFPIEASVLELIETAFAIRHQVLPLLQSGEALIVAVENPLAVEFLQDLRFQTSMTLETVIADPLELKERIAKEYASLSGRGAMRTAVPRVDSTVSRADVADLATQLARENKTVQRSAKEVLSDARVSENTLVRLVNRIIIEAHAQGASDIHIESNLEHAVTRIRFRKDGDLEDYLELPPAYSNSLVSRIKIMAELDISERRHPQDGKIDFAKHGPLAIELRVAVIPTANNLEDVVMRILSGADAVPLDNIGFSTQDLAGLKKMMSKSFGLILVCGPTGSGKTTTLHSLLREINTPDVKIWTAEDPIEITQPGLRQVQVNAKIDWTFAAAMRAFLRADPDVIMVGEMRDIETTKIGIEASLTGHLVISTLHTNSAAESVVRLLDLGMDPFNFADALVGVLSQRLARRLCPSCKKTRVATELEVDALVTEYCEGSPLDPAEVLSGWRREFTTDGRLRLRDAVGCEACKGGYRGRVVVYELLTASPEIKHLIRSRKAVPEIVSTAITEGMLSLRQNAIQQVLAGLLDLPSARAVAS